MISPSTLWNVYKTFVQTSVQISTAALLAGLKISSYGYQQIKVLKVIKLDLRPGLDKTQNVFQSACLLAYGNPYVQLPSTKKRSRLLSGINSTPCIRSFFLL